jgi:hypothetical protein
MALLNGNKRTVFRTKYERNTMAISADVDAKFQAMEEGGDDERNSYFSAASKLNEILCSKTHLDENFKANIIEKHLYTLDHATKLDTGIYVVHMDNNSFAEACYDQNSFEDLDEALRSGLSCDDCDTWKISHEEWREQIEKALAQKILDENDDINQGSFSTSFLAQSLPEETIDNGR